ncbi:MAG: acyl-CoA synthetase [Hyphomicrobiales bacterium]|jgi:acetyl-CoA synthetase|nr:acyl-CoA synthetase [Hyphomicrobiales bacterium]
MLPDIRDFDRLTRDFRWRIPHRYNIGVDVCDRWAAADPARVAVIEAGLDGSAATFSYGEMKDQSDRLANGLRARGIKEGDRVAILLPQGRAVPVAHAATYKLGAIAVPLAALFGVDAIAFRLRDAGAKALITDAAGLAKASASGADAGLDVVISTDGADGTAEDFRQVLATARPDFAPVASGPDDPALMIYTSGTTGNPKGALHGHRVLLGHLPGVQMPHEFLPQPGDRMWTPADWAWAGGLLNILLPALHFGIAVVARASAKFDPDEAFDLMARFGVRNCFVPPTALRMLRSVSNPRGRHDLRLRTIGSGGESLGVETLAWAREALDLTVNEFYGQTECNLVLASCAAIGVLRPGSIGKPVPGHDVNVIRPDGAVCEPGEEGQIAVRRPDPVMFLGYWNNPAATDAKFIGDWLKTGDQGIRDMDGYIRFVGRDDDVITSSGYRIGPGEIEDCLITHPAVALAAVVGKPDALRTEIVKAFVVLKPGHEPSDALVADIQAFVRRHLAAHEYPREIAFRDSLPMTTTGKIIRRELRVQD